MIHTENIFLGFDPGGGDRFGVASLIGDHVETSTVSSVAAAVTWAGDRCGSSIPYAAGVDTLLHWSDGPGGWRPADKVLRAAYPKAANSVISPNGLYGSMAIGGMALAIRLRERWRDILLNETHPKLLVHALGGDRYADADAHAAIAWLADHAGLDTSGVGSGHELDALLSAWATRQGVRAGWSDLLDDDPALILPAGRVSYLWADQLLAVPDPTRLGRSPTKEPRMGKPRESKGTTEIGYVNKHRQEVIRKTDITGSDRGQRVYVLRCLECDYEYGANGSDIWLRRCPRHGGGALGLSCSCEDVPSLRGS